MIFEDLSELYMLIDSSPRNFQHVLKQSKKQLSEKRKQRHVFHQTFKQQHVLKQ